MRTASRFQTKPRGKCAGEKKIRGRHPFTRTTCCTFISLPTTVWRTRNWVFLGPRAGSATVHPEALMAATSSAVAEATTPTWSGTWRGVSVSSSGAATSAAGGVKAWLTSTLVSNLSIQPSMRLRSSNQRLQSGGRPLLCKAGEAPVCNAIADPWANLWFLLSEKHPITRWSWGLLGIPTLKRLAVTVGWFGE